MFWHTGYNRKSVLKSFIDFAAKIGHSLDLLIEKVMVLHILVYRILLMDLAKLYRHSAVAWNPNSELDLIEHECFRSSPDMTFNNSTTFFVILSTEYFNKKQVKNKNHLNFILLASYNVKLTENGKPNYGLQNECTFRKISWYFLAKHFLNQIKSRMIIYISFHHENSINNDLKLKIFCLKFE